jgi:hypothetical protein
MQEEHVSIGIPIKYTDMPLLRIDFPDGNTGATQLVEWLVLRMVDPIHRVYS